MTEAIPSVKLKTQTETVLNKYEEPDINHAFHDNFASDSKG